MTVLKQVFDENTAAARFDVSSWRNHPLSTGFKLEEFHENEPGVIGLFARWRGA